MKINKEYIFHKVSFENRDDVLKKLGGKLEEDNVVEPGFVQALIERENNYSTGLPVNIPVAIPHTDGTLVKDDQLVFASLQDPIVFNEMGGDEEDTVEAYIIIMFAVGNGEKHLATLTTLINTIQDNEFVKQLNEAKDEDEMFTIIKENIDL